MEAKTYCVRCQADSEWREAVSTFRASPKGGPLTLCKAHLEKAKEHAFNEYMKRKYGADRHEDQQKLF